MANKKAVSKVKPKLDNKPLDVPLWANHEPVKKRNYKPLIIFMLLIIIALVWFLCGYEIGFKQGLQISELCQ